MLVVFVHGWSVTSTAAYGGLPTALARHAPAALQVSPQALHLAKYVSFSDEVRLDDLARGMQHAVNAEVLPRLQRGERFACITHSTGAPLVRTWLELYHRRKPGKCPLGHLVMLAPANHGSALAQLGMSRMARVKCFAEGVQPGSGVLDWLELGSDDAWSLNEAWLTWDPVAHGVLPFVLTGQSIDRKAYDNLNSYTGEAGSDGVVRVTAANLNYGVIELTQQGRTLSLSKQGRSARSALGVLPGRSHSGTDSGIVASVRADDDGSHPTLKWVLRCLAVNSAAAYRTLTRQMESLTAKTQSAERILRRKEVFLFQRTFIVERYCMFVFRLRDDCGQPLRDYDVIFTAGPAYDENHLAPGFFKDRQLNRRSPGKLAYYVNYDVMAAWLARPELEGKFGFKIRARPDAGYSYYMMAEYRGTFAALRRYCEPNQTLMVDIRLNRHVAEGVFRLTHNLAPEGFQGQPAGDDI